jgi:phosphonate transport system permease protein
MNAITLSRFLLALGALALVLVAFRYLDVQLLALLQPDALRAAGAYASHFLRPDLTPAHVSAIGDGALQTLAMSLTGTLLAALAGLLLALPASGRYGRALQAGARLLLNILRAVPELVWAALVVLAAGLGPNAGTLALALHTTGVLGRLFAEALQNTPDTAAASLRLAGSPRLSAFCYGTLPLVWPQLLAYTLYRWENNIRMAAVLGFVGGGGLGQMLYIHLSLFQEAQAATVIMAMLVLVLGVDSLSALLRRQWQRT